MLSKIQYQIGYIFSNNFENFFHGQSNLPEKIHQIHLYNSRKWYEHFNLQLYWKKGFGDGQTVTNLGFCHGFRHLNNTNIRYQHFSMSKPQMAFRNEWK